MNQKQIKLIRLCWQETYWDLGIYRWITRNLQILKKIFAVSFIVTLILAFLDIVMPVATVGAVFIALIWIAAMDHYIIGRRIRRVLNKLRENNIMINRIDLLYHCKDIIPK